MRMTSPAALTIGFGLCATLAGIQTSPAATMAAKKMPMLSGASLVSHGKSVAEKNGCNSCHAANYGGKKGFSPSIRANGEAKHYTSATFVRLMKTGTTNDGGHVKKPMPVYPEMTAGDSKALYAFLMTQK